MSGMKARNADGRSWTIPVPQQCNLNDPRAGWIYYIACRTTSRLKIGYTSGDVWKRLKALQTGSPGELTVIAMHPGTPDNERAIHEQFSSSRLHGEWFEMTEDLFGYVCQVVWLMAYTYLNVKADPPEWVLVGLRMMDDSVADLPDELAALIGNNQEVSTFQ